jgi:hypothetical protein
MTIEHLGRFQSDYLRIFRRILLLPFLCCWLLLLLIRVLGLRSELVGSESAETVGLIYNPFQFVRNRPKNV